MKKSEERRYILDPYDLHEPFASFLPGIAGSDGIPLWCFYVNRGQGVAGFGHTHKNNPIMEFRPADQAYRDTPRLGFRTFIRKSDGSILEPFCTRNTHSSLRRCMSVGRADFELSEDDGTLACTVRYATLPGEQYPALLRSFELRNISKEVQRLEILDGLPRLVPYGISDSLLKSMSTTASAWIATDVTNPYVPEFRVRASIEDSVEVRTLDSYHFAAAVGVANQKAQALPLFVDASSVFGQDLSLEYPLSFAQGGLSSLVETDPVLLGRYPSAFAGLEGQELASGDSVKIYSIYGMASVDQNMEIAQKNWQSQQWFEKKFHEYRQRVDECISPFMMDTGMPDLDAYTAQTALDNTLRGGMPVVWGKGKSARSFYIYNRKHGDMERDYNDFSLSASPYSTGFGNYRDMNQNRRIDVAISPELGTSVIHLFIDLIQPDGFNPLIVRGGRFVLNEKEAIAARFPQLNPNASFTPGSLFAMGIDPHDFPSILEAAEYEPEADFGEGYWVDHWTYNLDLIDNYLRIFPDCERELFFGEADYRWFFSEGIYVRPLNKRFRRIDGKIVGEDHLVEEHGASEFLSIRSTLAEKLFTLALIKCASLCYAERGLEMEAGRPGWYDALNGLPGLFGSSLSDGAELLRLLRMLIGLHQRYDVSSVKLFTASWALLEELMEIQNLSSSHERWLGRWKARDAYRSAFLKGAESISTQEGLVDNLMAFFTRQESKLSEELNRSVMGNGILPTYYRYEVQDWVEVEDGFLMPSKLICYTLPPFLEGAVKQMKLAGSLKGKGDVHDAVKESALYDRPLGMYVLNDSLDEEPVSLGRAKAFPAGWLENASVWLHMEYKYLLELLRAGDGALFWNEAKSTLIPFIDNKRYGRSPYENSSFIASSEYPVKACHGRGFVGRLSGATAEYLTMWNEFLLGERPFILENGNLTFQPAPCLPASLFRGDGSLEFILFGKVNVRYENPERIDLFNTSYEIKSIRLLNDSGERVYGKKLPATEAHELRAGKIDSMTVVFGSPDFGKNKS